MNTHLNPILRTGLALMVLALGGCAGTRPDLEGAWQLIGPGAKHTDPPLVKILGDGHFAFGEPSAGNCPTWAGGGTYTRDGDVYSETVTYHVIPALVGQTIEFRCLVEGDRWFHSASFEAGGERFHIDEIWERLEAPRKAVE